MLSISDQAYIIRYNITNISRPSDFDASLPTLGRKHGHRHGKKKPKLHCKDPINRDKPHCRFKTRPRYQNRTSPARTNGPLTPLGYTQFYLPDVDGPRNKTPEWKIEYSTFRADKLLGELGDLGQPGPVPRKFLPELDLEVGEGISLMEILGDMDDEDEIEDHLDMVGTGDSLKKVKTELKRITPWKMKDLTIGSYIKLARKLVAEKKRWKQFSDFM